ncbi:MAG: putative quinol monooxygenase [Anaerolineae bacterium]
MKKSSYIPLTANTGKENALADFLKGGAAIVHETEPGTRIWTALQTADKKSSIIFDTFTDEAAQGAHFDGLVAKALYENASDLVAGGWDTGVIPNISNSDILGSKVTADPTASKVAIFIPLTAKAGMEVELANLLTAGADIVADTEPLTLYWFGLHFGENKFGIIDFFEGEDGVNAHFGGKVAAALKDAADDLVEGGWDAGVVARVQQLNVLAFVQQQD